MKTVRLANTISLLRVISLGMFYKDIWLGLFFFSGDVPCQWEKMTCKSSIYFSNGKTQETGIKPNSHLPEIWITFRVWLKDRTSRLEEGRTGEKFKELLCLFPFSVNKCTPHYYGLKRINGHIRDKKYLEYTDKERSSEFK